MAFYHVSYILSHTSDKNKNNFMGDFIVEFDKITTSNYHEFREVIATELECGYDELVVLSFIELEEAPESET